MKEMALSVASPTAVTRWRFTVDDVLRMVAAGILDEDDRVELIEGELITMSPIGAGHTWTVAVLNRLLSAALGSSMFVHVQNPLQLSDQSAPQPDLTVVRPRREGYREHLPQAADALLVIEVADTSLRYDRDVKLPLYARADVVEVWVVNLGENSIEQYTDPSEEGYRSKQIVTSGQTIQARHLPLALAADDVLK